MRSKPLFMMALVMLCASCGGGDEDFTCTAHNDEVAAEIRTTRDRVTGLRTADAQSWEWLARVPWFGRYAQLERLESALKDLQDRGFMLAIACGETLARRSDLGLITVPRLNGAMLEVLERTGAMDVNARRAIGGAASVLRQSDHQLTDGLAALANEYDDRSLGYENPDASPPVTVVESPWLSTRNVVILLGVLSLLLWRRLMVRPIAWLTARLAANAKDLLAGAFERKMPGPRRRRLSKPRDLDDA